MKQEASGVNTVIREEDGRFLPGKSGNLNGRPKMTKEEKLIAKTQRNFIKEYEEKLKESLPLLSPVLIAKAMEGDITAIKEVNDRVMGKPRQNIGLDGGGEGLAIQFAPVLNHNDRTPDTT